MTNGQSLSCSSASSSKDVVVIAHRKGRGNHANLEKSSPLRQLPAAKQYIIYTSLSPSSPPSGTGTFPASVLPGDVLWSSAPGQLASRHLPLTQNANTKGFSWFASEFQNHSGSPQGD